jgi:hypothetical protein
MIRKQVLVLLQALPMITLYCYFATSVCRDVKKSVGARLLRVTALTDLGLYSEALFTLQQLLNGERLPSTFDTSFQPPESRPVTTRFVSSKPLLELTNLKVLRL